MDKIANSNDQSFNEALSKIADPKKRERICKLAKKYGWDKKFGWKLADDA